MHPSVIKMWTAYLSSLGKPPTEPLPAVWHFCDNQADADTCAALALAGRKRATAPSKWFCESRNLSLPAVGDLDIVTNWNGIAQCVIRTTHVSIVRFCDVTAEHAAAEGEGDDSLQFWRDVHWQYYQRELSGTAYRPSEEMPIICQHFERVFP